MPCSAGSSSSELIDDDVVVADQVWNQEHALLVGDYDPDSSMIILVGRRRTGRELFTYQMLFDLDDGDTVSLRSFLG